VKKIETIRDIDTNLDEGKLLIATLGRLSSVGEYAKRHPDEILREMVELAKDIWGISNEKN